MVHSVPDFPRPPETVKPSPREYLWALWIVFKIALVLALGDAGQAMVIYQNF